MTDLLKKSYIKFILIFSFVYMGNALYMAFIPIYLKELNFTGTQMGALLSYGPLIAAMIQPYWGTIADRSKTKNMVLFIILAGNAIIMALMPISTGFWYIMIIIFFISVFRSSARPTLDTIALESMESTGIRYEPLRMAGAIAYAIAALLGGWAVKQSVNTIFYIYPILTLLAAGMTFIIPRIKGHQSVKKPGWEIFKLKDVTTLIILSALLQIGLGYYYSFYPLRLMELTGSRALVGLATFIMAISELPFLLFAGKIKKKLGTGGLLTLGGIVMAVRWFLYGIIDNGTALIALQFLHGLSFIVLHYSMVTYLNERVPKELKASAQTWNALIGIGFSRFLGIQLGGILSDSIGIKKVFLVMAAVNVITLIAYYIYMKKSKNSMKSTTETL